MSTKLKTALRYKRLPVARQFDVYCATPPSNGAEGRQALKNDGWLNGGANAERIVVLLWSAT